MTPTIIKLDQVTYNASNRCFEALVKVQTGPVSRTYPCAIEAPLTMPFEKAAEALRLQALRCATQSGSMYSQMRHSAPVRAGRIDTGRTRFDARRWLAQLGFVTLNKAA